MGKLYVVTGASGHLGYNLVKMLVNDGKKVRILVNKNSFLDDTLVEKVYGNVTIKNSMEELFNVDKDTDIIFIHAAGMVSIVKGYENNIMDVNVEGTRNVVDLCIKHHVKKLIYVSSVHAMDDEGRFNPQNVDGGYAKTKAMASQIVLDAKDKINVSIVCPSSIIGPNDYRGGYQTKLFDFYINKGLPFLIKGGYDFVDVRDVALGIINLADNNKSSDIYILSGEYISMADVVNFAREYLGKRKLKVFIPNFLLKTFAFVSDMFCKMFNLKPLLTLYSLDIINSNKSFSHDKASNEINCHPRDIHITIKDTVDFLTK